MFSIFKKSKIEITEDKKKEFESVLYKIIELLRENAFSPQADWVRQIVGALIRNDQKDFVEKLNSVDMWGGAGAVWEVYGFQSKADENEFHHQIVKLTVLMKETGIRNRRAQSTGRLLRSL